MTFSPKKCLKRKSHSRESTGFSKNGSPISFPIDNDSEAHQNETSRESVFKTYGEIYSKLIQYASEVQSNEDCVRTTRIADITTTKLAQEIKKIDISSVDHWLEISSRLIDERKYLSVPENTGWSFSDLIPINRYMPIYFGSRNILLKRKEGAQTENSESSQKKRRVNKRDDNSQSKVSKPLEGITDEKPLPLIEHMNRVMSAIENNCNGTRYVDYLKLVVNPDSYSLTVYNIFTISFLIRENMVSMDVGKEGNPVISVNPKSKKNNDDERSKKHFTIELTSEEWKNLVKRLNIKSPMVKAPESRSTDKHFYEKFTMSQSERLQRKRK